MFLSNFGLFHLADGLSSVLSGLVKFHTLSRHFQLLERKASHQTEVCTLQLHANNQHLQLKETQEKKQKPGKGCDPLDGAVTGQGLEGILDSGTKGWSWASAPEPMHCGQFLNMCQEASPWCSHSPALPGWVLMKCACRRHW